jgi:glutamate formiminotransferase
MTIDARPLLIAAPNVSAGDLPEALARALDPARLLDLHSDRDHGRSVLTFAAPQGELAGALARLAAAAAGAIDLRRHAGLHPHVGALDVAPVVYPTAAERGPACAEALTAAALIGDAGLPVFLYGDLATDPSRRERAALREGGPERLRGRVADCELTPDYGPRAIEPATGAVLVTARPPLVAFNVELATADVGRARSIAARLRESGGGPPGVRAIGLHLAERGCAQVSMNVHDPAAVPLAGLVEAIAADADVAAAEIVGLVPRAALAGFPDGLPIRGFDPARQVLENALGSLRG